MSTSRESGVAAASIAAGEVPTAGGSRFPCCLFAVTLGMDWLAAACEHGFAKHLSGMLGIGPPKDNRMTEGSLVARGASTTSEVPVQSVTSFHLPRHVGVILDGNRRWAAEHQLPAVEAYRLGARRVSELVQGCDDAGIPYVTVWALSRGNLRRGRPTTGSILDVVLDGLGQMARCGRWHIRSIGAVYLLDPEVAVRLAAVEKETRTARHVTLNVALAYDGRAEIVEAVQALLADDRRRTNEPITEQTIDRYLSTAGQPDVDLVIRTSGERRLSGFMPWQTTQAELYFTDTYWPDFTGEDLRRTLDWFAHRDRRFGL